MLPYLDLFSLAILNPTCVIGLRIPTLYLPGLSILRNGQFRPSRTRAANAARIFDYIAAAGNTSVSYGFIPLSSEQHEFNVRRYWRLPINIEIVLAILIDHTKTIPPQFQHVEMTLVRRIYGRLLLRQCTLVGDDESKTHEKGEPERKRHRTEKRDALNEDLGLGSLMEGRVKQASFQSREMNSGEHISDLPILPNPRNQLSWQ